MRTRTDILAPLLHLINEADRHLHDAKKTDLVSTILTHALQYSAECPLILAERSNGPVDLEELQQWLSKVTDNLHTQKGHMEAAFDAYYCANALVEGIRRVHDDDIIPPDPSVAAPAQSE